ELFARVALLGRALREGSTPGCEAEAELAADLLPEAPRGEVVASKAAGLRLPEVALVERRRPVQQLEQPLSPLARAILLWRGLLVLELHAEPVGEPLDRADEVGVLLLLDEGDRVARLAA